MFGVYWFTLRDKFEGLVPVAFYDPTAPAIKITKVPKKDGELIVEDIDGIPDQDVPIKAGFSHEIEGRLGYLVDVNTGQCMLWMDRQDAASHLRSIIQNADDEEDIEYDLNPAPLRVTGQVLQRSKESNTLENLLNYLGNRSQLVELLREYQPVLTLVVLVVVVFLLFTTAAQYGVF